MKFINPYKLFVGCFLPNWLVSRKEISQGAKICYARLAQYAGEKGYAFPHQQTLADAIGVQVRQVKRYLAELETYKIVISKQQGLNRPNIYRFPWHEWMDQDIEVIENQGSVTNDTSESVGYDPSEVSDMTPQIGRIRPTEENHVRDPLKRISSTPLPPVNGGGSPHGSPKKPPQQSSPTRRLGKQARIEANNVKAAQEFVAMMRRESDEHARL